jgi:2-succinyl-6-hydroxy-2,4-cyclohexadiene-1-carboxylate synthase
MITKIYGLYGFLGLSSDWNAIRQEVGGAFEALDVLSLAHPREGLQNWGRALNRRVAKEPVQKRILLGYSMGGRLAMHALVDAPELWAGAIIVSANTGLKREEERAPRLQIDIDWARRFLKEPWEEVVQDWDRQAVFQGQAPAFHRREVDYVRSDLAHAIEGWSVGKQSDLQEPLSKLPFPILWVAGEKDLKYVEIAKQMASVHPHSSYWIAPEAGHRVPWECTQPFLDEIHSWMQRLYPNNLKS